jgi:hypothetical protein
MPLARACDQLLGHALLARDRRFAFPLWCRGQIGLASQRGGSRLAGHLALAFPDLSRAGDAAGQASQRVRKPLDGPPVWVPAAAQAPATGVGWHPSLDIGAS